jgi:ATP phosphoribosyltransferase
MLGLWICAQIGTIMHTETVVIKNKHTENSELVDRIMTRIKGYLTAQANSMLTYNIPRANLAAAVQVLSRVPACAVVLSWVVDGLGTPCMCLADACGRRQTLPALVSEFSHGFSHDTLVPIFVAADHTWIQVAHCEPA